MSGSSSTIKTRRIRDLRITRVRDAAVATGAGAEGGPRRPLVVAWHLESPTGRAPRPGGAGLEGRRAARTRPGVCGRRGDCARPAPEPAADEQETRVEWNLGRYPAA